MLLDGVLANTRLDRVSSRQTELDIVRRERVSPLPWRGQFSPQLVETLLEEWAKPHAVVLDPFLGSGTVLLEGLRQGCSCIGAEINPAPVALSRIYELAALEDEQRLVLRSHVNAILDGLLPDLPLFDRQPAADPNEVSAKRLVDTWRISRDRPAQIVLASLIVLTNLHERVAGSRLQKEWARVSALIEALPHAPGKVKVFQADARELPLPEASVDLVITSPPYINVFNYHQQYRRGVEQLAWDVLGVARSEIGANRKHRQNRFLTVVQYCLDMAQALHEMQRVVRRGGRMILVVGRESTVLGTSFFNGELVAEVAHAACDLSLSRRQERVFTNRFGTNIWEDILHFEPGGGALEPDIDGARRIAARALEAALPNAPMKSRPKIREALERVTDVEPSPLLSPLRLSCELSSAQ